MTWLCCYMDYTPDRPPRNFFDVCRALAGDTNPRPVLSTAEVSARLEAAIFTPLPLAEYDARMSDEMAGRRILKFADVSEGNLCPGTKTRKRP